MLEYRNTTVILFTESESLLRLIILMKIVGMNVQREHHTKRREEMKSTGKCDHRVEYEKRRNQVQRICKGGREMRE